MLVHQSFKLLAFLCIPLICPVDSIPGLHGDLCNWKSPAETCDVSRGLACSYKTQRCDCWDIRTIYSKEKGRCVGKSSDECHHFGGEKLCTENSYCLEDSSLSPIPICLCLKGYFRGINGSCIRRSKYGEFCDLSTKYPASSSSSFSSGSSSVHSSNSNCEPESGLHCVNYKCQCEPNQIYDPKRELCTSLVGMPCSRSLENCVQNSECSEKIWAFDHVSGETKMIGHRCACKPMLKVTEDGFCTVEYGGSCSTSSECHFREGLTCINGKCQCHPLSQVYDRRLRRCLNLVGTKCQTQTHPSERKQDHHHNHHFSNQQESSAERARMDLIIKPQKTSSSASTKPVNINTSPFTSTSTTTTTVGTTATPFLIKSRNVTSRNFHFNDDYYRKNNSRSVLFSAYRRPQREAVVHSISPRHYTTTANGKQNHNDHLPAEHRSSPETSPQQCVPYAECIPSSTSSTSEAYCVCKNGTSETIMRTCLLDHGEPCGQQQSGSSSDGSGYSPSSLMECNVFEGLVCSSDTGTCQCADPMLIYDPETRACLSTVGNPCGRMKLNPKLLKSSYQDDHDDINRGGGSSKNHQDSFFPPTPFYQHHSEQFMYINCVENAACVDKSVNGQFKQVCVARAKFPPTNNKFGFAS